MEGFLWFGAWPLGLAFGIRRWALFFQLNLCVLVDANLRCVDCRCLASVWLQVLVCMLFLW
jgi:hypothetical protein